MPNFHPGDHVHHDHPTLAGKLLTVHEQCPSDVRYVNCRYSVKPYTVLVDRKLKLTKEFDYQLTTWLKKEELRRVDDRVDVKDI